MTLRATYRCPGCPDPDCDKTDTGTVIKDYRWKNGGGVIIRWDDGYVSSEVPGEAGISIDE